MSMGLHSSTVGIVHLSHLWDFLKNVYTYCGPLSMRRLQKPCISAHECTSVCSPCLVISFKCTMSCFYVYSLNAVCKHTSDCVFTAHVSFCRSFGGCFPVKEGVCAKVCVCVHDALYAVQSTLIFDPHIFLAIYTLFIMLH